MNAPTTRSPLRSRGMAAAMILLVLPLAGCPLDLPFPLGEPGPGSLDPALEGRWSWSDAKKGEEGDFVFARFNANEYVVVGREKGKESLLLFRAFTTRVGASTFLNVAELKAGRPAPTFLLARYGVKDDKLSLDLVEESDVPKASQADPKALLAFLAAHPELPAPDPKPVVLERVKGGPWGAPARAAQGAPAATPQFGPSSTPVPTPTAIPGPR